jgi:hypothetical protein
MYNKIFLGYQLRAEALLMTRTEMVLETLVFLPLNLLTRLVARDNFIMQGKYLSQLSIVAYDLHGADSL